MISSASAAVYEAALAHILPSTTKTNLKNSSTKKARSQIGEVRPPRRPNYGKIHAKPLPLDTYPLPPLIPHNPVSLIQIAITYVCHIVARPCSHPKQSIRGYFCPETGSVHVTDEASIRLLWECGFFGKGSLSRSEPTWLDREMKRLGLSTGETSEEVTQQRREERRRFKLERARKEKEAIEQRLYEEQHGKGASRVDEDTQALVDMNARSADARASTNSVNRDQDVSPNVEEPFLISITSRNLTAHEDRKEIKHQPHQEQSGDRASLSQIQNQEHLQLTPEEAFFLAYALGVLQISDQSFSAAAASQQSPSLLSTIHLLSLFRSYSNFPPSSSALPSPADSCLLSYVCYHHFRSLGWVVRPGIKFAVNWLLYLRGPAFSHAEFAVIILPAFRDTYWRETEERRRYVSKKERRDWWWLHCAQRVQSQVRKGLVLCWVEIPSPEAIENLTDIGVLLKHYRVREMLVKRWIPNRSRD